MNKLLILLLAICALVLSQLPAQAQGVSWGIPLPFPFLFYNFSPSYNAQPYYGGYYFPPHHSRPSFYIRSYFTTGLYQPPYFVPPQYWPGGRCLYKGATTPVRPT